MRKIVNPLILSAFLATSITPTFATESKEEFMIREGISDVEKSLAKKPGNRELLLQQQKLRRDAVKIIVRNSYVALKAERAELEGFIRSNKGNLSSQELKEYWTDYKSYRARLNTLQQHLRIVISGNFGDFEDLEDFYSGSVSLS